jgi:predicted transcriptional regulator
MDPSETEALDRSFRALGDATRRQLWMLLGERPGATTMELAAAFSRLSRWAVMKHLSVLRDAGLVQTLPRGRQRCHFRVESSIEPALAWFDDARASSLRVRPPASRRAAP